MGCSGRPRVLSQRKMGMRPQPACDRSNGKTENFHTLPATTLVASEPNRLLGLMPGFIAARDRALKQDCERNGAKRRLERLGEGLCGLRPVYRCTKKKFVSSLAPAGDDAAVFHHLPQPGLCPAPQRPAPKTMRKGSGIYYLLGSSMTWLVKFGN
jgi:hypothetical protein